VAAVRRLAEEVVAAGSSLVLADDTSPPRHAAEHGWIDAAALGDIGGGKADEGASPGSPAPGTGGPARVVVEKGGDLP
jgi:hypothetical protein